MLKLQFMIIGSVQFFCLFAQAQNTPIGLFEGLMANSGVATFQSTAASFYNPSLLMQKSENSYSLGGNTFGATRSEGPDSTVSSNMQLGPAYLSTVRVSESTVHELFMASLQQGQHEFSMLADSISLNGKMNVSQLVSGYSLAFKSFPLAGQLLVRYTEVGLYGVSQGDIAGSANPNSLYFTNFESSYRNLNVALGLSSHFKFGGYAFGVNLQSRGLSLIKKNDSSGKAYIYGEPNPGDLTVTDLGPSSNTVMSNPEGKLSVGHSFLIGEHEFLTDSIFQENSQSLDRYEIFQTFGYRYGLGQDYQFLCGISHQLGEGVQYPGQSFSISTGFSWLTRALRSSAGVYVMKNEVKGHISNYGMIFSSQYEY